MLIPIDTRSVEDYRKFLAIKRLPKYRFKGGFAEFPDEYASRVGVAERAAYTEIEYDPKPWLFDYQRDIAGIAVAKRKYAVFADCGLGKHNIAMEYARHALDAMGGKSVLVVSPLMVVDQAMEECAKFYGDSLPVEQVRANQLAWWMRESKGTIGFTNYEAIVDGLDIGNVGALILDECFAGDTRVDCVTGGGEVYGKQIKDIQCGDRIRNAAGVDEVCAIKKREVPYAVNVYCGKKITCSPNHPFFTQRGWVGAQDLEPGDSILQTKAAMRMVQEAVYAAESGQGAESVLREILLSEMAHENTGARREGAYAGDVREDRACREPLVQGGFAEGDGEHRADQEHEPDRRSTSEAEDIQDSEGHEARTFRAWGKRAWFDEASTDLTGCVGGRMGSGVCFVVGEADSRLSHALQARLGAQRAASVYRGGWELPPLAEDAGPQERSEARFSRVDRLEVLEPGHPELERLRDADGKCRFYDLEASRHPSFSVNGLLVHNSSMLKSHYGKWGSRLIELGKGLEWKLCLTGTPAPNDRIEYANHAVFLDHFPNVNAFLARFFVNRGETQNRWELKPHALKPFYRALSHWCIFLNNPATYGWKDNAGGVPPISVHLDRVPLTTEQTDLVHDKTGNLFADHAGGITSRAKMAQIAKGFDGEREVPSNKPKRIKELVESWPTESTIIWCRYNREQDAMAALFPGALNIDGGTSHAERVRMIREFKSGQNRLLISKGKILGFGLNLQVCTRMIFSALQDSYEEYYQCVKRANRLGSKMPLNVHIPYTDLEAPMIDTVLAKARRVQHDTEEQERLFREIREGIDTP